MSQIVKLTPDELHRVTVLHACQAGHLSNGQAAKELGLSVRQIKRLKRRITLEGTQGLASKQRGQPGHHQLPPEVKAHARELLRTRYPDFGPTLAHEKLVEVHHLRLSREVVRQLLIQEGLWKVHKAHKPVVHQLRERRARRGELVQLDGSPYD